MSKQPKKPKIGQGRLAAAGRQGFKELGKAIQPFYDSIQVDEPGTMWSATPMQVSQETGVAQSLHKNYLQTSKGLQIMNDGTIEFDVPDNELLYQQYIDQSIEIAEQMPEMQPEMEQ